MFNKVRQGRLKIIRIEHIRVLAKFRNPYAIKCLELAQQLFLPVIGPLQLLRNTEFNRTLRVHIRNEVPRCIQRNNLPLIHQANAIAEQLRFIHVMRADDDRLAIVAHLQNDIPKGTPCLRIKPCRRFIQEHDLWIIHQCERDGKSLLLPAG